MFNGYWRRKAEAAEKLAKDQAATIESLRESLAGMDLRFKERAALSSISRNGRMIRFVFIRNGQLYPIEVIGNWSDDVDGWTRDLLGKSKNNG